MQQQRVLITGVTGMAGSHLVDYLLAHQPEVEIHGTYRWRSRMEHLRETERRIHLHACDLTDAHNTDAVIDHVRPDFIFHLAAQSFVPASWAAPGATLCDNIRMQVNVFEAVRRAGISPAIQIALSSEEYGLVLPEEVPVTEENPLRPLSPYAVSKVTQDMLGYQYWQSYGLRVMRTRTFNHSGPRRGEIFATSNFARQIAEIEAGLRPPVLRVGNLTAMRDWTDVRDVVRAYWLAANHCQPGEVYVICSGRAVTVQSVVDVLLERSPVAIEVVPDPDRMRPSDVQILLGDYGKFHAATGWRPEISFERMMADLLDYWRERVAS